MAGRPYSGTQIGPDGQRYPIGHPMLSGLHLGRNSADAHPLIARVRRHRELGRPEVELIETLAQSGLPEDQIALLVKSEASELYIAPDGTFQVRTTPARPPILVGDARLAVEISTTDPELLKPEVDAAWDEPEPEPTRNPMTVQTKPEPVTRVETSPASPDGKDAPPTDVEPKKTDPVLDGPKGPGMATETVQGVMKGSSGVSVSPGQSSSDPDAAAKLAAKLRGGDPSEDLVLGDAVDDVPTA